jgi:hypothetical protein
MSSKSAKKSFTSVISILIIGIAAFIGFGPLFNIYKDGITAQFLAAIFGTIFTIILTMFLLNKQTEIEEEKSRSESVFQERVELYKNIIAQVKEILQDGAISVKEMTSFQFMLVQLQMLSDDNNIEKFTKVYECVCNAFARNDNNQDSVENSGSDQELNDETIISPEDKLEILKAMLEFSKECRLELGLSNSGNDNTELFKKTEASLKKSQNAVEVKKSLGTRAEMKSEVKEQLKEYLVNNISKSKNWNVLMEDVSFAGGEGREIGAFYKAFNKKVLFARLNPLPPKKEGDNFKYKINQFIIIYNDFNGYDIEKDELGLMASINVFKSQFDELLTKYGFKPESDFFTTGISGKNNMKLNLGCSKELSLDNAFSNNTYKELTDFLASYASLNYEMMFNTLIPNLEKNNITLQFIQ